MSGHGDQPNYGSSPAPAAAPYDEAVLAGLHSDAAAVIARYPQPRSALLPLLHLVQSADGHITTRGIEFCADRLGLTAAEVSGVATFYTQYKRHPAGDYNVGVCTNTLCAVMGGDAIWSALSAHLGVGHDETTADGRITLERLECNAACDYAPVVMANWEFFDNMTPESTIALVDDLAAGKPVRPSRGPDRLGTFREISRVLAGFLDEHANEGVSGGPASLRGTELAKARGWTAPAGAGSVGPDSGAATAGPDPATSAVAADPVGAAREATNTAAPGAVPTSAAQAANSSPQTGAQGKADA